MNLDWNKYSRAIKSIESSGGNYQQNITLDGRNKGGHALGAYQFIPSTLASLGATKFADGASFNSYVNQEYKKDPTAFNEYCKGRTGAVAVSCRGKYMLLNRSDEVGFDLESFVKDPSRQDGYFRKLTENNHNSGAMRQFRNASEEEVGKRLALMHFTGNPYGRLQGGADLYGTTADGYSNRFRKYYEKPLAEKTPDHKLASSVVEKVVRQAEVDKVVAHKERVEKPVELDQRAESLRRSPVTKEDITRIFDEIRELYASIDYNV